MRLLKLVNKIVFSSIVTLIALPLSAQEIVNTDDIRDMVNLNTVPTFQKTNVKGTPYVLEDFETGYLELYSGARTENLKINFNVYENRIEIIDDGKVYAVSPGSIRKFEIDMDGEERVFKKGFKSRRLDVNEFVEVVVEGPISFLIKHEVSFSENSSAGYGSATREETYKKNERFYFRKDGEVHALRRLNNRRVSKYFEGNKEVNAYIKENNLDLSNPEDIAKAVRKFNSSNS